VTGIVFLDENGNGLRDAAEPGIPQVHVSDGEAIALTNETGAYALNVRTDIPAAVFVVNPDGYTYSGGFYTQVSADFLEGYFNLPAPSEPL
jgi:hypothetical protein